MEIDSIYYELCQDNGHFNILLETSLDFEEIFKQFNDYYKSYGAINFVIIKCVTYLYGNRKYFRQYEVLRSNK